MKRATLKMSLPQPYGCALFKTEDQAPIGWIASVCSCLTDEFLFGLRGGLERYFQFAFDAMLALQGGATSDHWQRLATYPTRFPRWVFSLPRSRCQKFG